jgi:hypothetical protein
MWANMSASAQATVTGPHSVLVRVSATTTTRGTLTNLPIVDGEVTVSSGQINRRSCGLEVDPAYWPDDVFDPFSPVSSEIFIEYGVLVGVEWEWIPVFYGPVQKAGRPLSTGAVKVTAWSREAKVAENRMDAPAQTVSGATVVAEITRLIQESIPAVTVTDQTGSTAVAAQITIDRERWRDGVEKLADSIGAEVYADPIGGFIIRPQPLLAGDAVLTIQHGENGTLVDGSEELTRERVYNRVVVEGVRTDGTPPVRAVVDEPDNGSPTWYGGPFGKKPRFYTSQLLTTVPQCTATGDALLARVRGMQSTITLDQIPNPGLESGDLIEARLPDGRRQLHIVDGFNFPLKVGSAQRISSRSLELDPES